MKDLEVLIVGAGIGGLQTALALAADGDTVTILESVREFLEVGAGIRVPPNSTRLSLSWGVDLQSVLKETSLGNRFVDWHGTHLLDCPFDDAHERYGASYYYFIHRADLINALVTAVKLHPLITLRMDTAVISYNLGLPRPAVSTSSGEHFTADDTGDIAYRILVPASSLLKDPDLRDLVTHPWATHWIGPEGHAVGYPLRGGQLYNVIIDVTHGTDLGAPIGVDEWRVEADNHCLVERFKEWCPQMRKLCAMASTYLKWKLADFEQLGCVYMAQGAAQATEDAATLAAALRTHTSISAALEAYESQRKPRAAYVAANTRILQQW
ncbi:salicylate hydroxylase [Roridomyces roridus]|uniref:Salicylate hydroxylase n=1 Tax=Roridomyces roridus TaxID=1738132 RepID=A0AAD7BAH2_9AGAR|nr:salicylate hydroxylase [Roridomyces roridus]